MSQILVVDDDRTTLEAVSAVLTAIGHLVIASDNPTEVEGVLTDRQVDAMILDVMMPELNGFDLLREIRMQPRWSSLPILMLSSLGEVDTRVQGIREGADDYIVKPFDPKELAVRVERLIARRKRTAGVDGSLESFPLPDLLQHLKLNRKTGVLHVTGEMKPAKICFREGKLVRATQGSLEGQEAILALLEQRFGLFHFEDRQALEGDGDLELSVNLENLLMTSAWLEDELQKRESFLPYEDQRLIAAHDRTPTALAEFEDIPVARAFDLIAAGDGCSLLELADSGLASPAKLRLAVALLLEQGVVQGAKSGQAEIETSEIEIQEAHQVIDALVESYSQRGYRPQEIYCLVLYQANSWEPLQQLISSLPKDLVLSEPRRLLRQLEINRSGVVPLRHQYGRILLSLLPLKTSRGLSGEAFMSISASVILWLSEEMRPQDLSRYIAKLEEASGKPRGIIQLVDPAHRPRIDGLVENSQRWRVSTEALHSFEDLQRLLMV